MGSSSLEILKSHVGKNQAWTHQTWDFLGLALSAGAAQGSSTRVPLFLTNLPLLFLLLVHLFHLSRPCRGDRCGQDSQVLLPSSWHTVFWGRAGPPGWPPLCNGGSPAAVSKGESLLGHSSLVPDVDNHCVNFKGYQEEETKQKTKQKNYHPWIWRRHGRLMFELAYLKERISAHSKGPSSSSMVLAWAPWAKRGWSSWKQCGPQHIQHEGEQMPELPPTARGPFAWVQTPFGTEHGRCQGICGWFCKALLN